jgi:hypothetical protein
VVICVHDRRLVSLPAKARLQGFWSYLPRDGPLAQRCVELEADLRYLGYCLSQCRLPGPKARRLGRQHPAETPLLPNCLWGGPQKRECQRRAGGDGQEGQGVVSSTPSRRRIAPGRVATRAARRGGGVAAAGGGSRFWRIHHGLGKGAWSIQGWAVEASEKIGD